jgi:hypothetical protein
LETVIDGFAGKEPLMKINTDGSLSADYCLHPAGAEGVPGKIEVKSF